jgi:hypothetical protein
VKQYNEIICGVEYHVLEYDTDDLDNSNVINEIFKANLIFKYLKIIDKTLSHDIINYYLDGMKHNESGPAKIMDNKKEYYILDQKISENSSEFKAVKRTELIDRMLNDK